MTRTVQQTAPCPRPDADGHPCEGVIRRYANVSSNPHESDAGEWGDCRTCPAPLRYAEWAPNEVEQMDATARDAQPLARGDYDDEC